MKGASVNNIEKEPSSFFGKVSGFLKKKSVMSPLHIASLQGNVEIVQLLLAHHADPSYLWERNNTFGRRKISFRR